MNLLVTGGCRFIGGHLCELFVKKGHSVVALDDLSTGSLKGIVRDVAESIAAGGK